MRFLLVMDSILTLTVIQDFMSKRGHDIFRRRPRNDKRTEIRHREYQKHPTAPAGYVMPGLADAPDGLFRNTVKGGGRK